MNEKDIVSEEMAAKKHCQTELLELAWPGSVRHPKSSCSVGKVSGSCGRDDIAKGQTRRPRPTRVDQERLPSSTGRKVPVQHPPIAAKQACVPQKGATKQKHSRF